MKRGGRVVDHNAHNRNRTFWMISLIASSACLHAVSVPITVQIRNSALPSSPVAIVETPHREVRKTTGSHVYARITAEGKRKPNDACEIKSDGGRTLIELHPGTRLCLHSLDRFPLSPNDTADSKPWDLYLRCYDAPFTSMLVKTTASN